MNKIYKVRKQSLFDYYKEEYKKFIYEIIKSFKITNINYYEIIVSLWGESYNKYTGKLMNYEERLLLEGAKQKITRYIKELESNQFRGFTGYNLSEVLEENIVPVNYNHSKNGQKVKKQFLNYFDEKYKDLVLKMVNLFKIYYPDYYFAIEYYYYGDEYQIKKNWVQYNPKIAALFNSARIKINKVLEKIEKLDNLNYDLSKLIISRNASKVYFENNNIDELYEEIEENDKLDEIIDNLYDTMEEFQNVKEKKYGK